MLPADWLTGFYFALLQNEVDASELPDLSNGSFSSADFFDEDPWNFQLNTNVADEPEALDTLTDEADFEVVDPGVQMIVSGDGDDMVFAPAELGAALLGSGSDVFVAAAPVVLVNAGLGDDTLFLEAGAIRVHTGPGNNTVVANGEIGAIFTDDGEDHITLNAQTAEVMTYGGSDTVIANAYVGYLGTGWGADTVTLNAGGGTIRLAVGADILNAQGAFDLLHAGAGDDQVTLVGTATTIILNGGDDQLSVTGSVGTINAGSGDDTITVDGSVGQIIGGAGNDSVTFAREVQTVDLSYEGSTLTLRDRFTGEATVLTGVEQVTFGDGSTFDVSAMTALFSPGAEPAILVGDGTQALTVNDADPTLSVVWDRVVQQAVIEETGANGPTIASRAYSMVHTAIYDAWAAFDSTAVRVAIDSNGNNEAFDLLAEGMSAADQEKAMNYAASTILKALYPEQNDLVDNVMTERYGLTPDDDGSLAAWIGIDAAEDLLALRQNDGANQEGDFADTTGYTPVNPHPQQINDITLWTPENVPLDPENTNPEQSFLTPHWLDVEGFALPEGVDNNTDLEAVQVVPPQPFFTEAYQNSVLDFAAQTITLDAALTLNGETFAAGDEIEVSQDLIGVVINEEFINQALEVIEFSADLTDETKLIAEFWEDAGGTSFPPGTWMSFAQYASELYDHTTAQDAQLFLAISNAVFDAGIATWYNKVEFDYVRPVRAIRDLGELGLIGELGVDELTGEEGFVIEAFGGFDPVTGEGLGTHTILAENFITYQRPEADPSPPFAEYTSGHSGFSAAGAAVLAAFTGSDAFGGSVTFPVGSAQFDPSVPSSEVILAWATFSEAADEAGISRLHGGIHFTEGDVNGRELGRDLGEAAFALAQSFWEGTATNEDRPFFQDALVA